MALTISAMIRKFRNLMQLVSADDFVRGVGRLARFSRLHRKYEHATMVSRQAFVANLDVAQRVTKQVAEGAIVECGTWKGGMAAALIEVCGPGREYYYFDSFEGLPQPKLIDGPAALKWQTDTTGDMYFDNCTASLEEFRHVISLTGISPKRVHVHKGFFEETLPGLQLPAIAVLRLDGDWYDSTMICLEHLYDKVLPGGAILIDDYYTWDGCSRAVHDFLSRRKAPERIRQEGASLAVLVKE